MLRALRIGVPENRTTALLAVTCDTHRDFGNALAREALRLAGRADSDGLKVESINVEAPAAGYRVDLELIARSKSGLRCVWFEAKWDAAWEQDQLVHYDRALESALGGDRGALVVLMTERRAATDDTAAGRVLSWERLAVIADKAGAARHGAAHGPWRRAARQACGTVDQFVLDLLLEHLEEEHDVTVSPLTATHAHALAQFEAAKNITDLLAQAGARQAGFRPEQQGKSREGGAAVRWMLIPDAPNVDIRDAIQAWTELGAELVLWRSVSGKHHDTGGAALIAGLRLPDGQSEATLAHIRDLCARDEAEKASWPLPIRELPPNEGFSLFCSVLPLQMVAVAAADFVGQTTFVATWLRHTVDALASPA